jgi:hypothetical protein
MARPSFLAGLQPAWFEVENRRPPGYGPEDHKSCLQPRSSSQVARPFSYPSEFYLVSRAWTRGDSEHRDPRLDLHLVDPQALHTGYG